MSSLDDELGAMARREAASNVARATHFTPRQFVSAKATEAPRMNGVRLNSNGTVTVNGTTYTRAEFRGALEMNMREMRNDPKSAYNDRRHPDHAQAVSEMQLGYRFLGGELTEADEKEIVTEWHDATQETEVANTLLPHQEIAQIVSTTEGRTALNRARTGQPLDDRQRSIVSRHDELLAQNNTIARKEQASRGGTFSTRREHYIHPELYRIESIQDPRERAHAIRAWRAGMRDDPKSAYNDVKNPDHKNAIEWVQRSYQAEEEIGPMPEDGK